MAKANSKTAISFTENTVSQEYINLPISSKDWYQIVYINRVEVETVETKNGESKAITIEFQSVDNPNSRSSINQFVVDVENSKTTEKAIARFQRFLAHIHLQITGEKLIASADTWEEITDIAIKSLHNDEGVLKCNDPKKLKFFVKLVRNQSGYLQFPYTNTLERVGNKAKPTLLEKKAYEAFDVVSSSGSLPGMPLSSGIASSANEVELDDLEI